MLVVLQRCCFAAITLILGILTLCGRLSAECYEDKECVHTPRTDDLKQYCGKNAPQQDPNGTGNCKRQGILKDFEQQRRGGVPAVTWSVVGNVSREVIASGCYCIIDE